MKLIPHAKTVAWRSFSMWANYLGVLCLIAPELIFWAFERDTNPRIWWLLGLALIVFGILGRLLNQTTVGRQRKCGLS
jgi:lysozyme